MEKKYNSKIEYISEVMEEICMGCLTFLVAVTVVASLFFGR
jgi:hypothetical protein